MRMREVGGEGGGRREKGEGRRGKGEGREGWEVRIYESNHGI